jgi:hypothetical protein
MSAAPRVHLLSLADREFRRQVEAPAPRPCRRAFKGLNLNLAKFDTAWDRKRGSAARLMGVLLREGSDALHRRVCADEKATQTYDDAATWLAREARYLRRVASQLDTAAARVQSVLAQCREGKEVPAHELS